MALKFKPGDAVVQIVAPINGVVVGPQIIDADVHWLVKWTDASGENHERYFSEEQIELIPATPEVPTV